MPPAPYVGNSAVSAMEQSRVNKGNADMAWTVPTIREVCVALEINGYMPSEF